MKKIFMTLAAVAVIFGMVACEDNTVPTTPGGDENTETPGGDENTPGGDENTPGGNENTPGGDENQNPEPKRIITIDGQFDDWDTIELSATCPEGNTRDAIKTMKLAADDRYVYLYLEVLPAKLDRADSKLTIYLDDDNNDQTGAATGGYFKGCFRYAMQASIYKSDAFVSYDPNVDMFTGADNTGYWDPVNENEKARLISSGNGFSEGTGVETDDAVYYECALVRADLETLGETIALGVYLSSSKWEEIGVLPSAAEDLPAEFLVLELPEGE